MKDRQQTQPNYFSFLFFYLAVKTSLLQPQKCVLERLARLFNFSKTLQITEGKGERLQTAWSPQHFPSFTGLRLEVNTISFSLSVLLLNSTITYTSGRIVEFVSRSIHFCFTSFSFEKSEKVCFMVAK